jgi:pilus assembly protein CpaF
MKNHFTLWIQEFLNNPSLNDCCLNVGNTQAVFADFGSGLISIDHPSFEITEVKNWVLDRLTEVGKTWDAKCPYVDATLKSGHRLHVVFAPIAQPGLLISLRQLQTSSSTQSLAHQRWQHDAAFESLKKIIRQGDSMILCGATGSGKTTLASDLLTFVPAEERIIALEDTSELNPSHPQFVKLLSRPSNADGFGEVTLRALLKQTLRMRPDRIILGECRGPEILELIQALNTGHRGFMATLHANSARDGIKRLELLCMLAAHGTLPLPLIRELISHGIQWIVHLKRNAKGQRAISEVIQVVGMEGSTLLLKPVFNQSPMT